MSCNKGEIKKRDSRQKRKIIIQWWWKYGLRNRSLYPTSFCPYARVFITTGFCLYLKRPKIITQKRKRITLSYIEIKTEGVEGRGVMTASMPRRMPGMRMHGKR